MEVESFCLDCRHKTQTKEKVNFSNQQTKSSSRHRTILRCSWTQNFHLGHYIVMLLMLFNSIEASPIYQVTQQQKSSKNSSISERVLSSKPSWHDPCGIKHHFKDLHKNSPYSVQKPKDQDLLHGIVNMAKMALRRSRHFKEDYVKKTFHEPSWWDHHERWKDMRYRWLPTWEEVPKHLHENALLSHYQELEMLSALQSVFTSLQKLAAGMEQVVIDQVDHNGQFLYEFDTAQFDLKTVLCEIEYALLQKGVKEHELKEVPREIIPENVRNLEDESYRNLRDWYIYRDYMNGLEYVVDAFNYLKKDSNRKRRRRRFV